MMTETAPVATEKRLWRFEAFTMHDWDKDENDIQNYTTENMFIWAKYDTEPADLDTDDDNRWDNVETIVFDGMDAGTFGRFATHKIYPASFGEISENDLFNIRIMAHLDSIGDGKDHYWPASVFMHRELLTAYDAWVAEKSHPVLDIFADTEAA